MAYVNLFQSGFRQFAGEMFNNIFSGVTPIGGLRYGANASLAIAPQNITATGTTQLGAALITSALAVITIAATASTHGVRLPSAATGIVVQVGNHGAFGAKVWPFAGDKIGAAATNAADSTVLAINKMNTYQAIDATNWVVNRGA